MQSANVCKKGDATSKLDKTTALTGPNGSKQGPSGTPASIRLMLIVMKRNETVKPDQDLIPMSRFRGAVSDEVRQFRGSVRNVTLDFSNQRIIIRSHVSAHFRYPHEVLGQWSSYPGTYKFVQQLGQKEHVPQISYLLASKEESRLVREVRGWWVDLVEDPSKVNCMAGIYINEGMPTNEAYVCFFIPKQGQEVRVRLRQKPRW